MGSTEPSSFGELLKRYRTAAGLTQEELAERAGLSTRGVQDLERGVRRNPHPDTNRRLAAALGLGDSERAALERSGRHGADNYDSARQVGGARRLQALPVPLTPLVGRDRELERARSLLDRPGVRLLTLLGPAGTGKTRLALALANAVAEGFTHGAAFVDLAPVADGVHVPRAIAYALGLREAGRTTLSETLREYLQNRHLLLVLDNFEHLVTAASTLAELLSTSNRLKMLLTSRSVLRVYGEHVMPVPPLGLPPEGELLDCERLAECGAIRLFVERVQASDPSFVLTPENAPIVEAICRRLDGLPLALELAASRVRLLPLEALLARLEHRLPMLVSGARNLPPRHQTLRAAIDWSYGLLGLREQALFRRMGVFTAGCTLAAAVDVCLRDAPGTIDVLEVMGGLVDASLVLQQPGVAAEPRFRLLETLREYALEQLAANGELAAARRAHAEYYIVFAERTEREQSSPQQKLVWDRLSQEHDNIRTAVSWCEDIGEVELGLRLVDAMHRFWHLRGHIGEGRAYTQRLLTLPSANVVSAARANALVWLAQLARIQGNLAEAGERAAEGLKIGEALEDRGLIAFAHGSLGYIALDVGDIAGARRHAEMGVRLATELGDRWVLALCKHGLGDIAWRERDWPAGHRFLEQALEIWRELGDPWGIAQELWLLGYVGIAEGKYREAGASFAAALAIERALDRKQGIAHNLLGLGWVALEAGHATEAERLLADAVEFELEVGRTPRIAEGLEALASAAAVRDRPERALILLGAADAAWERMGHRIAYIERATVDRWLAPARRALGEAGAEEAWQAGRMLSVSMAVASVRAEGPTPNAAPRAARQPS